ncbi:MAG: DUF493 domain-containing protein [Proteobacteria bacterium]|nr:DUF493 domain-containing protein [Pseudomonadota bacterium]
MNDNEQAKGFEFPCEYPIKIMGLNTVEFYQQIVNAVKVHVPEVSTHSIKTRTSSSAKYQSITILVYARSKQHLIDIYQDIKTIDGVKWTL